MKEKISIIIEDVDDIQNVLQSIELLFRKLIAYYTETDIEKLNVIILCVSAYLGQILKLLGWDNEDFKE